MNKNLSDEAGRAARPAPPARASRTPMRWVLDLWSSVPLGIVILTLLFFYSTFGSAGIVYPVSWNIGSASAWRHEMVRQWPAFEMTEFEWFHTPVFLALCGALALNIAVTTLRRIPFRVVNFGVWMIHTGIIMLVAGSVVYFGTKVEGDTPVMRREVVARIGDAEIRIPAMPGAERVVSSGGQSRLIRVTSVDPQWPLLTGEDAGKKVFSVSVVVEPISGAPEGVPARYVRQMLAGYPQYTEDVIPGRGRTVKLEEFGTKIIDPALAVELDPGTQDVFWVRDSVALAVRPARMGDDAAPWAQRVVHGVPRYNDWIPDADAVWDGQAVPRAVRPFSVDAPRPAAGDALGDVSARVIGFVRYGVIDTRREPGGGEDAPVIDLRIASPNGQASVQRVAIEPGDTSVADTGGFVEFRRMHATDPLDACAAALDGTVTARVGEVEVAIDADAPGVMGGAPIAVGDSGWTVRVSDVMRNLNVGMDEPVSLAVLDVTTPEGETFTRWAFPDPAMTRDIEPSDTNDPHGAAPTDRVVDARLVTEFHAGTGSTIVFGMRPDGRMAIFQRGQSGGFVGRDAAVGDSVTFGGGASITIASGSPTSSAETKPAIVPESSRDRDSDAERVFALALVELSQGEWVRRVWLPFCKYSFDDPQMATAGLARYEPERVMLPNGSVVEIMFTRERRPLPNPVMLEDFVLTAQLGGFTGDISSIRDWTSVVRFDDGSGWGAAKQVATNEPAEHRGFRYFQAYWDAPRSNSAGMSFTGLGVGNRRGVGIQLVGCCISVIGMAYAFYVKPIIKRRRRERVVAGLAAERAAHAEPKAREAELAGSAT